MNSSIPNMPYLNFRTDAKFCFVFPFKATKVGLRSIASNATSRALASTQRSEGASDEGGEGVSWDITSRAVGTKQSELIEFLSYK